MKQKTIDYYNKNADKFTSSTQNLEFTETQDKFLGYLSGNKVLDFGCGAGRDSKYFLSKGYDVSAIDGSLEMVRIASELTGLEVKHMYFEDLSDVNVYDGIWACSSILHCTKDELVSVLSKMVCALKESGVIYTSFKYSEFEGYRNDRYFTDFTSSSFHLFLESISSLMLVEEWISSDIRPGRDNEKWLNVILKKK